MLLFFPGFASTQEPDAGSGSEHVPKQIDIGIFVLDVFSIDSVDQTTWVDFIVRARWRDERLAGGPHAVRFLELENLWTPELQIVNARDLRETVNDAAAVTQDGTVTYRERHVGTVTTRLDLSKFPFDRHEVGIRVAATALGPNSLEIREEWSGQAETLTIADWQIGRGNVQSSLFGAAGRELPSIVYQFGAVRHTGYWVWKVMFPLILIVGMSWTVFWIDPAEIGAQVGTATASMLTLIAYRFALGSLLPRVSYFTGMDSFITAATLLVFMALLVAILTGRLAASEHGELARRIDLACRGVFPLTFAGVTVYAFSG